MAFPTSEQLRVILEDVLISQGYQVEGIKIAKAGAKSSVRITVDSIDPRSARPDLDAVEVLTRDISAKFDHCEEEGTLNFGPGYTLEVSTPGLDSPLTKPRHYERNIGRTIKLPTGDIVRIAQVSERGVVLLGSQRDKKAEPVRRARFEDIAGAVVEVEFSEPPQAEKELVDLPDEEYDAMIAVTS